MTLTYGSVCSGIEAATVAWEPLGWRAAFFSEIDRFPRAVLAHHYPDTPLHGDFTTIKRGDYAAIDLLVGGTPCQSFSVAGLRGGLDDDRGNLALEYLRLADRLRPTWLVWENVPGVLSSGGGRDFGAFLGGLVELGYGFAYRVLDAQYVRVDGYPRAVPQRRRRVFVVGCAGGAWQRAAAVLLERESLSGHPAPRREAGEAAPRGVARGALGSGADVTPALDCATTGTKWGSNQWLDRGWPVVEPVAHTLRGEGFDASEDGTGRGTPLVAQSIALRGRDGGSGAELGGPVAHALRASQGGGDKGHVLAFDPVNVTSKANRSRVEPGRPCHTLHAHGAPAVAFHNRQDPDVSGDVTHPLGAKDNGLGVLSSARVRRLMPLECERLQGFPDGYTRVPYRGKDADDCPDGPRYKAIGNSMAVNVMRWLGRRIELLEATCPT